MKLKIAEDLSLPLDVVTEKLAFLGRTGSGKTYAAMKLAELMLAAGAQVGAIDPVGVWRGLRVPAAKGGPSFDVVVFGGLSGDLPLEPTELAGHLVADLVTDRGLSFVLDVSQMIPSEQQRFVRGFADRFFARKKAAPSAVHLFMEECQEFIPENPSGDEAKTLGVMQRLWKLGRNFGIGGSLISQRPQEIAKKALNMSGTLFAFQMTGPQERKAIKAWVADQGVATDIEGVLQKLDRGQPHVESPTFLAMSKTVRILPRASADLSSTPKVAGGAAPARALTPIDVAQLKTSMAATIEKAKADDPRELRKQLAALQQELRVGAAHIQGLQKREGPGKVVEKPVLKDSQIAALDTAIGRMEKAIDRAADLLTKPFTGVREQLGVLAAAVKSVRQPALPLPSTSRPASAPPVRAAAPRPAPRVGPESGNGDGTLSRAAERKVLTVLAQYPDGRTVRQVAILAGYAMNGGGFRNAVGRLRSLGYLDGRSDRLVITEAGAAALGEWTPLPTGEALAAHWLSQLDRKAEREVLQVLLDAYPSALTAEEVAAKTPTSYEAGGGGFRNALGKLKTLEIIDAERGSYRASAELFS